VVAVAGVAAIAWALSRGAGQAVTEPLDMSGLSGSELMAEARPVARGAASAPVEVMVFSDYTCPGCRSFAQLSKPTVMELVEDGTARLLYYDFPLGGASHPHSFISARAARCAGDQDHYWDYQDVLFARQDVWAYQGSAPLDAFIDYAGEVGMDTASFAECLRSDAHAQVVSANLALAVELGINSTPTVFVGSRPLAGNSWADPDAVRAAILRETGS
jgi:protein-disulfide isomerase